MIVSGHSSLQFPLAQNNMLRIELLHEHQSKITQHLARLLRDGVVRKFTVLGVRHPYNVYFAFPSQRPNNRSTLYSTNNTGCTADNPSRLGDCWTVPAE